MNRFEKVSLEQYEKDFDGLWFVEIYDSIKIPKRATMASAGYDFFSPFDFVLYAGETIKIPTGIKVNLDADKFLAIVPRSGLGFKYRIQLDNTIGIIDSDYINSDNEGHIFIKLTNDGHEGKELIVKQGEGIAQGIILPYFMTVDDETDGVRNGGFGSTNK